MSITKTDLAPELDVLTVPLSGINLIEASAGTGKTWTITGLYVRLLLERGLDIDQILVVTYTKAATAELRERIMQRLSDTRQAMKNGASDDPFCGRLIQQYPNSSDRAVVIRRLDHAIGSFDEAAVYTIHSFCQRVLNDSPFESGIEFEFELMPDESELIGKIIEDFWRLEISQASGIWADYLLQKNESPEKLAISLRGYTGKPYLKIIPSPKTTITTDIEQRALGQFENARLIWQHDRSLIESLLLDSPTLNRNKYRPNSIHKWCLELDNFFTLQTISLDWPRGLDKFTTTSLSEGCKKKLSPPEHGYFNACALLLDTLQTLKDLYTEKWVATRVRLLNYCNRELETRKLASQHLSYNDLLNRLNQALCAKFGAKLGKSIRNQYRAALIDEFQDTDPVQYNIFKTIYFGQSRPVVFVGDPKQAIYGFRGADVFSYLQARQTAANIYSLKTNRRSSPALIGAINKLFMASPNPFITPDISYPKALAVDQSSNKLRVEKDVLAPFRILRTPSDSHEPNHAVPRNKTDHIALACQITVDEITALLNQAQQGSATLTVDGHRRALHGGDIAILVGTHRQAQSMQHVLSVKQIPSVRHGQESVFQTLEAYELYSVLQSVAKPASEALIKATLITELVGFTANEISQLQDQTKNWEDHLDSFRHLNQLWQNHGFTAMFRRWFDTYQVATNLADYQDGERRLTNILHLAELLQVAQREHPGCDSLLKWLANNIRSPEGGDESTLLRLESDAERVKIVTIHSSKGLEYPVVFCPFLWDGSLGSNRTDSVEFHDPSDNYRSLIDLGSNRFEQHKNYAEKEKFAENLRLLYVGLTRAKHRCYVVWGTLPTRRNGLAASAFAWLLHGPRQAVNEPLDAMGKIARKLDCERIDQALKNLTDSAPQSISVIATDLPTTKFETKVSKTEKLRCAKFHRKSLIPAWRMSSYSGLTSGLDSETSDYDPIDQRADEPPDEMSIFSFPRGAVAGTCLHSILESWDFQSSAITLLQRLVQHKLYAHGIATDWTHSVSNSLLLLLNKPLGENEIKLKDLDLSERLVELEFCFPLKNFSFYKLKKILSEPSSQLPNVFIRASQDLSFEHFNGYMKGYIDLVFESNKRFYIVDYKSNWLGNGIADYAPNRLFMPMAQHHYYIQYLIYSIGLHRYLACRIPDYSYDQHFGGIFYLFLRGIGEDGPNGIFETKPSYALIRQMDDLMDGK